MYTRYLVTRTTNKHTDKHTRARTAGVKPLYKISQGTHSKQTNTQTNKGQDFESFSWQKAVEATQVNVNKALQVRNVVQEISGHTHKTNTQTNTHAHTHNTDTHSWQKAVEATQVNVNKALQV